MVAACAGLPTLFTLSVTGRVGFDPADPLDAEVAAAFDAHQRRTVDGRTLLGPDAVDIAVTAFRNRGIAVEVRETPWSLPPGPAAGRRVVRRLGRRGREQNPDLAGSSAATLPAGWSSCRRPVGGVGRTSGPACSGTDEPLIQIAPCFSP